MLFRYNRAPRTTAALGAVLAFTLCLTGCGGGNDNPNAGLPFAAASPAVGRFVGSYTSTVALGGGKTGTVALTVGADNRATGTLTVTGGDRGRQAQSFSFASGVYAISGTVDPTTGAFTMSGNIGGQPFSYTGTLPTPGNGNTGGSYTLTYGTQTYTGIFGGASQPVASPSPSPSTSPSPGSGGGNTSGQGGTLSFAFSNVSGASIDASAIASAPTINGVRSTPYPGTEGVTVSAIGVSGAGGKKRSVIVTAVKSSGSLAVGDAFTLNLLDTGGAIVSYGEASGVSAASVQIYSASSGTVTVVAISATSVTLRVTNAVMGAPIGYPAAGTFTMNGDVTGTLQ